MQDILEHGYGGALRLSQAALDFGRVYSNPFELVPARLPVFPMVHSQLLRTYASATLLTNSNGYGWLYMCPAGGVSSNGQATVYSNGPGCSNVPSPYSPLNDTGVAQSNSQYTNADFDFGTGSKQFRPVSVGIRVRYVGTNLEKAGVAYTAQLIDRASDVIGEGISFVQSVPGFKTFAVSNNSWHSQIRHITSLDDQLFQVFDGSSNQWKYLVNKLVSYDNQCNTAIWIKAEPNQSFEFQFTGHYEITGRNLHNLDSAMPDPPGVEHIVSSHEKRRFKDTTTPAHSVTKNPERSFWSILKDGAKQILPSVIPMATKLLMGLL